VNDLLHIVCAYCDAVNRLPQAKLKSNPVCGKCTRAIFDAPPIELNERNFDRHITRNDIPVLIDFWAPWCGPCRSMAPAFEQAARILEPFFRIAKLNTEEAPNIASRFAIRSIPTLMLFHGGRETARQAGAMDARSIVSWARTHVV
jgi:thioredoxin 2